MQRWLIWIAGVGAVRAVSSHGPLPTAAVVWALGVGFVIWLCRRRLATAGSIGITAAERSRWRDDVTATLGFVREDFRRLAGKLRSGIAGWAFVLLTILVLCGVAALLPDVSPLVIVAVTAGAVIGVRLLRDWRDKVALAEHGAGFLETVMTLKRLRKLNRRFDRETVSDHVTALYTSMGCRPPTLEWAPSPPVFLERAAALRLDGHRRGWLWRFWFQRRLRLFERELAKRGYLEALDLPRYWQTVFATARDIVPGVDPWPLREEPAALALLSGGSPERIANLAAATPWFLLGAKTVLLLDPPVLLRQRPGARPHSAPAGLHSQSGPAIRFSDGWAVWAIDGIVVPPELVESPDSLDPLLALQHPNIEVRRLIAETIGWERVAFAAKPESVVSDAYGRLLRFASHQREPLVLVEVENATRKPDGSFRRYYLRVPPTITTPHEAVAWTFGLPADTYTPHAQS